MYLKIKNKVNNLLKDGRGAIFSIFILELILTIFITPDKFDDATFIESVTNVNILDYVKFLQRIFKMIYSILILLNLV